jgi:DNA adenine methylase
MAAEGRGVTRPVLRWHGGKWKLAPWIIEHFPSHRVYVEPFGGAASVLLRKERAYAEVYNDLDDDVVNLFRCLRDEKALAALVLALRLTPFARTELNDAYQTSPEMVERARRLVVRSFMGFGSNGHNIKAKTGFRSNTTRIGTTPAQDWVGFADCLPALGERLSGVVIEHKNALELMPQHDGPGTLFYIDPPYMVDTRSLANRGGMYAHEMDDADHAALLQAIRKLRGMVVLSGYPHALYDDALSGWRRVEREAMADGARRRTEVLWINPACAARLDAERAQLELLDGAA